MPHGREGLHAAWRGAVAAVEGHPAAAARALLRRYSAEAAAEPAAAAVPARPPGSGAALQHAASDPTTARAAARAASGLAQALQDTQLAGFVALEQLQSQQAAGKYAGGRGAGVGGSGAALEPPPVLQALQFHRARMDTTPAGRQLAANWQRQIILETRAVEASAARYRKDMESAKSRGATASMPAARRMILEWFQPLTQSIREEQRAVSGARGGRAGVREPRHAWGGRAVGAA